MYLQVKRFLKSWFRGLLGSRCLGLPPLPIPLPRPVLHMNTSHHQHPFHPWVPKIVISVNKKAYCRDQHKIYVFITKSYVSHITESQGQDSHENEWEIDHIPVFHVKPAISTRHTTHICISSSEPVTGNIIHILIKLLYSDCFLPSMENLKGTYRISGMTRCSILVCHKRMTACWKRTQIYTVKHKRGKLLSSETDCLPRLNIPCCSIY